MRAIGDIPERTRVGNPRDTMDDLANSMNNLRMSSREALPSGMRKVAV